ncbi:hypothetical protein [Peribacillus frigoritolerans]|uniref:hypothetical protein n=1 Tax=Peribacillus frigoritolerans TaxID=450367 RepID=UPI00227FB51F|nr:hypothetical protein [Peribacillus frigoritolerans]MCY9140886.1 hypothetical protein [Peribacillus frigoritolerans]
MSTLIARPKTKVTINMFIVFMVMFAKEPSFVRGRVYGKSGMIPLLNRQLVIAGVL